MKNNPELSHHKDLNIGSYRVLIVDLCCVVWSYLLAVWLRFGSLAILGAADIHVVTVFCILLFCLLYNAAFDANRNFYRRGYYVEFITILKRNAAIAIVWGFSLFLIHEAENFSRLVFFYYIMINTAGNYICRLLFKRYLHLYYKRESSKSKMLLVTDGRHIEEIISQLTAEKQPLYEMTAAVIWDQERTGETIQSIPVVADRKSMFEVARQMPLDEALLYLPSEKKEVMQKLIRDFEVMGLICHYGLDLAGLEVQDKSLGSIGGLTVVTYALNAIDRKHQALKRCMDIIGGLIGLILTIVLFPFVALAIRLESKGPILFKQIRIGKNGRRFQIYKFRSMYMDAEQRKQELMARNEMDGPMFKMEQDPRVTRVGRFLRKTSIDELPQFYNVLRGDMSLVGTRPPTEAEFEQYDLYYRRRLCMTPGLTGMWQVSGRSAIKSFDEVVELDLKYIDTWSLSLDIKIILQTIFVVLFGRGAK